MARDIGLDLGTSSVLIFVRGKGIVLEEPSVVAIDTETGDVKKVGREAEAMIGRTPPHIATIRPLKDGVISQYDMTLRMMQYFLHRAGGVVSYKPRMVICVPSGITEVEERALIDAATQSGASKTYLIEEPIAAALGAGIDIDAPKGCLVVDIGGGTTDIAVLSMGGIVVSDSVKTAGDAFDDAIIRYVRKNCNLCIGDRTAEAVKIGIGCVCREECGKKTMEVRGRCLAEGLPRAVTLSDSDTLEAREEPLSVILDAVCKVIERIPTELLGDVASSGIVLTGGGAMVGGLAKRMEQVTGLHCRLADDPAHCVAKGTGAALARIGDFADKGKSVAGQKRKRERLQKK